MRSLISGILDAPFYGMVPLELIWDFTAGWWHLKDIKPRPYHWFAFDLHNNPIFRHHGGDRRFLWQTDFISLTARSGPFPSNR